MEMWTHWEKELTYLAAEEDANKLIASLSKVLSEIVFYYLIFPRAIKDVYTAEVVDIESSLDTGFLQFLLDKLGLNNTYFNELFKVVMRNTYKYIVSDLGKCGLESDEQELITTWSRLLFLLYPVFLPLHRKEANRAKTPKIEINIYSDEIISAAVSPRFMNALRMLSLREHIVSKLTPPYVVDGKGRPVEYIPLPLDQLPKEIAEILEKTNTISAPDLAFLASVSYQYVTKLVRAGKIPARKKGKFILISVETAVAFAISRPTAPKWLKTLANQVKIAPLGI
jgi:hypothetical protein